MRGRTLLQILLAAGALACLWSLVAASPDAAKHPHALRPIVSTEVSFTLSNEVRMNELDLQLWGLNATDPLPRKLAVGHLVVDVSYDDEVPLGQLMVNSQTYQHLAAVGAVFYDQNSQHVMAYPFDTHRQPVSAIEDLFVSVGRVNLGPALFVDTESLRDVLDQVLQRSEYVGHQPFVVEYQNQLLVLATIPDRAVGRYANSTYVFFFSDDQSVRLTGSSPIASSDQGTLELPSEPSAEDDRIDFDRLLEELGLGGIEGQFEQIKRQIILSRTSLKQEVARRGLKAVRGLLLYGPPGTGKTKFASGLAKALGATHRVQMIVGTEIFSKWVGQSEENIRSLFAPAREDPDHLHVVIIDEIDALLGTRGLNAGSSVYDKVVNQFLGELDGLVALDNVLVIGMTNRLESLDPAVIRPGRLEVHVQFGLPTEKQRVKILEIHTRVLSDNGLLSRDVCLEELARLTKGFSGAHLEGLVRSAGSYSLWRVNKTGNVNDQVTMDDLLRALDEMNTP